jgi:pyruvate dehydrogenase E1 component alpha subunit
MVSEIVVPDVGATGSDVTLVEWLVKAGDNVKAGDALFTVETDKATMDVEAFRDGYIRKILVPGGSEVELGTVVGIIADSMEEPLPAKWESETAKAVQSQQPKEQKIVHPVPSEPSVVTTAAAMPARRKAIDKRTQYGESQAADESKFSTEFLLNVYRRMVLIRRFEDELYRMFLQGLVPGTLHQCQGQEAVAVGVCSALRNSDAVLSTHRPTGHLIAKGVSPRSIAAEIFGKATGCAGGRGGQMHLSDMSFNVPPSNAIVGSNIPIATGMALGFKLQGLDSVAVSFFGDGASNTGAFHEGINLAAVKKAPVVFVCENNLYGASTHISLATRVTDIAERARAYGIFGQSVDGMDVLAVHQSARAAVERARGGEGPSLLEYKTYRYSGHSRGDPCGYRSKEEVEYWHQRDPIPRYRKLLIEQYQRSEKKLDKLEQQCQTEIAEAVAFAQSSANPKPETVLRHVHLEGGDEK